MTDESTGDDPTDPGVARVVADADVLAADLLVGGDARDALDIVRRHSWVTLLASGPLLATAESIIEDVADADLAADWRAKIETLAELVDHPPDDHPALASAAAGDARHVLSLDAALRSATAAATIRSLIETSVKHPAGFARLFDPETIHPVAVGGSYPGPDRDPRD